MSWVPLPWWTSKSTMATRSTPWAACACRAATAALLKKQKPIGVAASAWWPGGRVATKALSTRRVDDLVDGEGRPAGRAQRRLEGAGRHRGVGIELDRALARAGALDRLDVVERMDPRQRLDRDARRGVAREKLERFVFERLIDGAQSLRPFGMAFAHVVRGACRMRHEQRRQRTSLSRHGRLIAAEASPEPPPMSTIVDPRSRLHGGGGSVAQAIALTSSAAAA